MSSGRYIGLDRDGGRAVESIIHKSQGKSYEEFEGDIFQQLARIYTDRERRAAGIFRAPTKLVILSAEEVDSKIMQNIATKQRIARHANRPKIINLGSEQDSDWAVVDQPKSSVLYWATFGTKRQALRAWVIEQRNKALLQEYVPQGSLPKSLRD